MARSIIPPENVQSAVRALLAAGNLHTAVLNTGVSERTLTRIAAGKGVHAGTIAQLARIADRTRKADEFIVGERSAVRAPRREQPGGSWSLERIREARDAQMRGHFHSAVRLAEALRTDDALFTAYHNRIAPQSAVQTQIIPYPGVRGAAVVRKAESSVFVPRTALGTINGTIANHGIAIGYNEHEVNEDGTQVNFEMIEWPLEWVRWNASTELLETSTRSGVRVHINHGDGRWVVFRKFKVLPWTQEACLLPAALIWAAHANGIRDWAAGSRSHGEAKLMGEMPAGIALGKLDADGNPTLSDEAFGFLRMLQQLMTSESDVGVRPAGSKTELLTNASTAWQVFAELLLNREKAAARVYNGTDAMLGSAGGAPGVDIATLFGVQSTKVQGDFTAIEQGLITGVYQPWCAINEGDSRYAPTFKYQLPDPDAAEKSKENSDKRTRLYDSLDRMRTLNLEVTQDTVDVLCRELGIKDPPQLGKTPATQLQLPEAAVTALVLGKEARAAYGLEPFGDDRDTMTLDAIAIYAKGNADYKVAVAKADATGAANAAVAEIKSGPGGGGGSSAAPQSDDASQAPTLPGAIRLELAPTDVARIVRVREARASQGLPPLGDDRDNLTIPELEAAGQAKADIEVKQAPAAETPPAGAGNTPPAASSGNTSSSGAPA